MTKSSLKTLLLLCLTAAIVFVLAGAAGAKKPVVPKKGSFFVGCEDTKNWRDCQNRFSLREKSATKIWSLWFVKSPEITCKYIWGGTHNADHAKLSKIKRGKFSGTLVENDRVFELPQGDPGQVDAIWKIKGAFKSKKRVVITFTPTLSKEGFCTGDELKPLTITYRAVTSG